MDSHAARLYDEIHSVIRKIPRGKVATYAQVAALAGIPRGGRVGAAALKVSTPAQKLPWFRVIGRSRATRGRIAIHDPIGAAKQRALLEREGVLVSDSGTVDLTRFGWLPVDAAMESLPSARKPQSRTMRRKKA